MSVPLNTNILTLTNYVLAVSKKCSCHKNPSITSDLSRLLYFIQIAVKMVKHASTSLFSDTDEINVQGELVKKLDRFANEVFINMLKSSFTTCLLVSEECENLIEVEIEKRGKYIVCFDPLDGSSNIDCLINTGSIFAIFKKEDDQELSAKDVLQRGKNIIAAGYALYGTATIIVLSLGNGVNEFILDPTIGEFVLKESNLKIPNKGNTYSINEGREYEWEQSIKDYIRSLKETTYTSRYIGTLVADIHRTIKYGGIYLYPAYGGAPTGKIRLLYECIPMAFLVTQAGGSASNGKTPILDIIPETLHQRSPIFIGSKENVEELLSIIKKYDK